MHYGHERISPRFPREDVHMLIAWLVSIKTSSTIVADLQYAIHSNNKLFQIHSNSQ